MQSDDPPSFSLLLFCSGPIDMDTDVLCRPEFGGKDMQDEKRWGKEQGRKIDELIQRETDRGGVRRGWSGGIN